MIRKAIALAVLAVAVPSIVLGQDSAQHGRYFSCESGDCNNGRGTIVYHVSKNRVTGEWRNGRYVDGVYDVAYGAMPSKTFKVRYGNDGVPREGTLIRGRGVFTGTFSRTSETFVTEGNDLLPLFRRETVVFGSGRYVDSRGYAYEGEFDYIPLLRTLTTPQYGTTKIAMGVFVFLGVRIDEALDEVKRGLFVSEETEPGEQVIFSEASPSYLTKLREELVASRASDAAERAEQARSTREAFNMILGAVGVVATVAVLNKAVSAASDRSVLSTLNRAMSGNQAPSQAARDVASKIEQRNASAGVTGAGRKPASVTVAEYQAAQQRRPEQAPAPNARTLSRQGNALVPSQSQSTSTPPRAALLPTNPTGSRSPGGPAIRSSQSASVGTSSMSDPRSASPVGAGNDSTPMWTYDVESNFIGTNAFKEADACAHAEKQVADFSPTMGGNTRKLLSRGSCECRSYQAGMGRFFECRIPYKMQVTSPFDPNRRAGGAVEGASR